MEQMFMNASCISAIILAFVGIIKLPFKNFKEKHPNAYKAVFCILSILLSIGASIIVELYFMNGLLISFDTFALILITAGTVTLSYNVYEGVGLKSLVAIISSKVKELFTTYSDAKLKKIIGTVGMEKLNQINNLMVEEQAKKQAETATTTTEPTKVEIQEVK